MQRRKVILPHEQASGPPPRLWPERLAAVLVEAIPAAMIVAILAGLVALALTGCAPVSEQRREAGYTTRDELRAACATAAHAYAVAIERTRAGEMAPATFRAVDDGYAGVVETCRRVLAAGEQAQPADAARVAAWTARTQGALP